MKRTILALLLVLSLLTGCGGSSDSSTTESAPMDNGAGWMDNKGDEMYGGAMDDAVETETVTGSTIPADAKMIYTANLHLETKEFDEAIASLEALVSASGGYFETRELHQGGTYRSLYCTVRVPVEHFLSFLNEAGNVAHMTYRNEDAQNVSEAYYDLEARLTTQRTKLQRLQELLSKAENMEDIITIESAISDTELQIEYLTGSLRKYDSLIGYSTVTVDLSEVYRLSTDVSTPLTFGERMGKAFTRGLERFVDNLEDLAIYVAGNWLNLVVWAVVIWGGVVIWRKVRTARKAKAPHLAASGEDGKKDGE